jgi:hypothetical protein
MAYVNLTQKYTTVAQIRQDERSPLDFNNILYLPLCEKTEKGENPTASALFSPFQLIRIPDETQWL